MHRRDAQVCVKYAVDDDTSGPDQQTDLTAPAEGYPGNGGNRSKFHCQIEVHDSINDQN